MQPLRPARVIVGERLSQPGLVAQALDILGRQPRPGQQLAGEQHDQPAGVEPVVLRALALALQRARLSGIGEPHLDAVLLQLTRDPPPPGRRLDRDNLERPVPLLDPRAQRFSRRLETVLGNLTVGTIEHRGLKDRLVDVDRGQHPSLPSGSGNEVGSDRHRHLGRRRFITSLWRSCLCGLTVGVVGRTLLAGVCLAGDKAPADPRM